MEDFVPFHKLARLSRECVVTEKIDGTNAQIYIGEGGELAAGSRNRYLTPESDNFGFARWVAENAEVLVSVLGPGRHFGEWWGRGIQRGYNQIARRFSLFNTARWEGLDAHPSGLFNLVPVLYTGLFDLGAIQGRLDVLASNGSVAAPGYPFPEGVVIYHKAANVSFKKTIEHDEEPKGKVKNA
jgi:hypothetical protein